MENFNLGWIKLHRSLLDWEWYTDQNTCRLFIHLLLRVNFDEKRWKGKQVLPGQLITSIGKLSDETGLSIQSIRTALEHLKSTGEITDKKTNKYRVITVNAYEKFQEITSKPTINQQSTNNQLTTTKEIKKERSKEIVSMDAIASRKQNFSIEVNQFENYSKTMLNAFIDYWTEPNKSKTKMRFEMQKTWDTSLRLKTWASREKINGKIIEPKISKKFETPVLR